jgi:RND superfamily putative drug exporter
LQSQLRPQFPEVNIQLTGETPLNLDFRKVSADDVNHAEARVLPVTLILLLIAFGSVVAAMLPLGVGLLAISMTMGAAALLANHLHLSILVENLATMLGLGLGIDYALLMVNRFRVALADGHDANDAADIAAHQAGRTLVISAATVAIGFAALLTVPISELSSIGVAGLLVASMSVLICTCILPWVLGLLGVRVNSWRLHLPGRWQSSRNGKAVSSKTRWCRWGHIVTGKTMDRIDGGRTTLVGTLVSGLANLARPAARQLASRKRGVGAGTPLIGRDGPIRHCPVAPGRSRAPKDRVAQYAGRMDGAKSIHGLCGKGFKVF